MGWVYADAMSVCSWDECMHQMRWVYAADDMSVCSGWDECMQWMGWVYAVNGMSVCIGCDECMQWMRWVQRSPVESWRCLTKTQYIHSWPSHQAFSSLQQVVFNDVRTPNYSFNAKIALGYLICCTAIGI